VTPIRIQSGSPYSRRASFSISLLEDIFGFSAPKAGNSRIKAIREYLWRCGSHAFEAAFLSTATRRLPFVVYKTTLKLIPARPEPRAKASASNRHAGESKGSGFGPAPPEKRDHSGVSQTGVLSLGPATRHPEMRTSRGLGIQSLR
jgi:hypothetical protein